MSITLGFSFEIRILNYYSLISLTTTVYYLQNYQVTLLNIEVVNVIYLNVS